MQARVTLQRFKVLFLNSRIFLQEWLNDIVAADNNTIVWTTTKPDCDPAALGLKTNRNYLPVNWHIIKQGILNVVMPTDPAQNNRE